MEFWPFLNLCRTASWPYIYLGWATSMSFTSINSTNLRTKPLNFHKKILRIGDFEKCCFFSQPFWILFGFFPIKKNQSLLVSKNFDQAKHDNTFWPRPNTLTGSVLPPIPVFSASIPPFPFWIFRFVAGFPHYDVLSLPSIWKILWFRIGKCILL